MRILELGSEADVPLRAYRRINALTLTPGEPRGEPTRWTARPEALPMITGPPLNAAGLAIHRLLWPLPTPRSPQSADPAIIDATRQ